MCVAIGCWLLVISFFSCLVWSLLFLLAFKLAEKVSCLWWCLVNLSIDCWLFIRKKMGQQFKSQPKKLTGKTFSFWLQFSFSATFKVIYQIFFGYLTNNKPKTKNQLKYEQKNYEPSTPKIFTRPTSHLLASSYIHIILN